MRKPSEKGNVIVIIAIVLVLLGLYYLGSLLIQKYYPKAEPVVFVISNQTPWRPYLLMEILDTSKLNGFVQEPCTMYVRGQYLDRKGTIPEGGKFQKISVPLDKCDKDKQMSVALGTVGYFPVSDGSYYSFTTVGFAPAQGEEVFATSESILYDSDWDPAFKPRESWADYLKRKPKCIFKTFFDFDMAVTKNCFEVGFKPQGEIMWQAPYGPLVSRMMVAMVNDQRVQLFPITAFDEDLLPLLAEEFDTDAFYEKVSETLYLDEKKEKKFLPWGGLLQDLNPMSP